MNAKNLWIISYIYKYFLRTRITFTTSGCLSSFRMPFSFLPIYLGDTILIKTESYSEFGSSSGEAGFQSIMWIKNQILDTFQFRGR